MPKPVRSKWPRFERVLAMRDKPAEEMNYLAQFLYTDPRCPPIGGQRRMTTFSDVLDAVAWQKKAIEKAKALDSWESRLDEGARLGRDGVPGAFEAHRVAERQRHADLYAKGTAHSTGALMQKESFDAVYSDAHADKDTYSVLKSGSLVPSVDVRVPTLPEGAKWQTPPGCALLPARSVMGIGTGPGRSIDF